MGRKRRHRGPHGIVNVDKPEGPTSATVMRAVQRTLGVGRAGHAGTLDPAASGVLVVLLGEATKLSDWIVDGTKEYVAEVVLGAQTDTLDREGAVTLTAPVPADIDETRVRAALAQFIGEIQQVPPVYSALKVDGRSLMSRARAGEVVTPAARPVTCYSADLVSMDLPRLVVRLTSGKGFYVRSFARDLGAALGCPAHLGALRRTRVGHFCVEDAKQVEGLGAADVTSFWDAVEPSLRVLGDPQTLEELRVGRPCPATAPGDRAVVFDPDQTPVALVRRAGLLWQVARGFHFPQAPPDPLLTSTDREDTVRAPKNT